MAGGERPRSVLVASLGGSAVVADVLELLAEPGSPVPVSVRRNLPLPGWVGPLDLVVAVSLSGRARGPLALAAEAARRGASLLTVGAADSPLADVCARARGRPRRRRAAAGPPRARSLWSLLTPVLLAADALGLVEAGEQVLYDTADRLDEHAEACRPALGVLRQPGQDPRHRAGRLGPGGARRRPADRRRRRPGRLDAGAHRPHAGVVRRAAGRRLADRRDVRRAVHRRRWPRGGQREPAADIFADPFLDGPAQPRLGLLMLRDAPVTPVDPGERGPGGLHRRGRADRLGRRACASPRVVAEPGHPLVRLAGQIAQTDFAATYLAIGLGLDPSMSPHVADLRDRTHR